MNIETSTKRKCFGRHVIELPVSSDELTVAKIKKYLPYVLEKHRENVLDYEYLHGIYRGKQDILNKTRMYNDDGPNNRTVENHIFSMVEFKKGFVFGNDVKYSSSETISSDDIGIINKYMKGRKKASKNVDLAEDIYVAGCGYRLVLPTKSSSTCNDLKKKAPFEIFNLSFTKAGIVYSSDHTHEKLFGFLITVIETDPVEKKKITIYTKDKFYEFDYFIEPSKKVLNEGEIKIRCKKNVDIALNKVPFVEYRLNKSRLGIVEIVQPVLDSVNVLSSNTLDNIEDFVNSLLAIYNMDVSTETGKILKESGIIPLQTNDPSKPADAKYLVNALDFSGTISEREARLTVAYDIVGVPRASSQMTSGGDTGQARLLGGGWSRAEIVANQDIVSLKEGERDMLELCLDICNAHPDCEVNEIDVDDVEITFNINKSDNLLVKTQSLQNLYSMNFPKEAALNIVNVVADTYEVAKKWEENEQKAEIASKNMIDNAQ